MKGMTNEKTVSKDLGWGLAQWWAPALHVWGPGFNLPHQNEQANKKTELKINQIDWVDVWNVSLDTTEEKICDLENIVRKLHRTKYRAGKWDYTFRVEDRGARVI
jgi:hypothetical protein